MSKQRRRFLAACAGFASLMVVSAAQAGVVTFDSATDLANNFNINVQSGTAATPGFPGFVAVTSGGLNNSGAVDVTAGPSATLDATAVYNQQSFNPQAGTITISQFVKVQATPTIGDRLLHLGIIDDPSATHQLNGGGAAHADFISARLSPTVVSAAGATTAAYAYQVQAGNSPDAATATATFNNTQSANFNLNIGDWYQFTVNVNRTATANTFSVDGVLQDFGTDGLTPGAIQTFAPQTIATDTTDMYNDTSVFGAFRSHAGQGGADLLDTFSISQNTPEPTTLGFLGLGAIGMLARRRRA
jgi:hypothetical protein